MSYIGVQPTAGQYRKLDNIASSFNGATTTFTTSVGGINVTAGTPQQLLVSVGGVIQQPVTDYTTSTNSITFSTAPAAGLDFFAVLMGDAINIGTPSDGSVTTSKLASNLTVDLASGSAAAPSLTFDANTGIFSPGEDLVAISTGGTERTRIDSSGRVGIGTTSPAAWSSPYIPVQLGSQGSINFGYGSMSISNNIYRNNVGAAFYINADLASSYEQNSGQHIWFRAASGTAGAGATMLESARIDSSGRLLVGTSSARSDFFNTNIYTPYVQLEAADDFSQAMLSVVSNALTNINPNIILAKTGGATKGSKTIVSSTATLGALQFQGADGAELVSAATISCDVDGTPGANDMPGRLVFSTTADGASSPTERMRIGSTGNITIPNSSWVAPSDNSTSLGLSGNRWTAVYAVNGTIQTSDQREKTEVANSSLGSDFVKSLRPVSYKWIEGGKKHTGEYDEENNFIYESVPGQRTHWGFIAQEVKEAVDAAGVDFGGWVLTDKDDPDSQQALRYDQFIAPLTKALQEALAEIDVLKAKVAALESA